MIAAEFFAQHAHNYSPQIGMCDWVDQLEPPHKSLLSIEANTFVRGDVHPEHGYLYRALMARFGISAQEAFQACRKIYADWNNRHQILMGMAS